jgi:predicted transcriptional regulator
LQDLEDYEQAQETVEFIRAVVKGLADIESGRTVSHGEAVKQLGLG